MPVIPDYDDGVISLIVMQDGQPTETVYTFDTLNEATQHIADNQNEDYWLYIGSEAGVTNINPSPSLSGKSNIIRITFPSTMTGIDIPGIQQCANLIHADFPFNVQFTELPYATFWDCTGLTDVTMPDEITSIADRAFCGCLSLERAKPASSLNTSNNILELPSSVTSIGEFAFWKCQTLQNIVLPSSLTQIKRLAFAHCDALTSIELPSSVTSIVGNAFDDCENLLSIVIHKPINSIGGAPWGATNAIVVWDS